MSVIAEQDVSEMISSRTDLRVVLLTAKGKNFSAGIDYARFVTMTRDEAGHVAEVDTNLLKHIENLPIPVIRRGQGRDHGRGPWSCARGGHPDRIIGRGLLVP